MSRARLGLTVLFVSLVVTGCGGKNAPDDLVETPSSTASPALANSATGAKIAGTGFTFNALDGWEENDGSMAPAINFLALAVDPKPQEGFADSVNVIEDPTIVGISKSTVEESIETLLSRVASNVRTSDPVDIDGEPAMSIIADYIAGPVKYHTLQYVVEHNKKGYAITFAFNHSHKIPEWHEMAESVIATWKWTS